MSRALEGLNEAQRQAVLATSGPVLVAAGPGTGKTLTMVRRIAFLVEQGVEPEEIVAVTFTNRAAREMRERLDEFLGGRASGMFIGTFHLLGLRIMRENLGEGFGVCDRKQQVEILEGLAGGRRKAEEAADAISRVKNFIEEPGDEEGKGLLEAYESELRRRGLYDFDDLIAVPLKILSNAESRAGYEKRFRHVIVDEYQDINPAQYRFTRHLADGHGNICVVGDSDQAIYAFRGADIGTFLNFGQDFPGASTVMLTTNYRSSKVIVNASSRVIKCNTRRIEKEIEAEGAKGALIAVISVPDERREAEIIVREIKARMGATSHYDLMKEGDGPDYSNESYGFSDFAVIFRTNAQVGVLEEVFRESGMPYQVVRGGGVPGIGKFAEALREIADRGEPLQGLDELIDALAVELKADERDRAILRQVTAAHSGRPGREALAAVLDELALLSTGEGYDPRAESISLMTMHMAKGLEFKVAFVAGVEDGLIPLAMVPGGTDVEEERRLFYVGMTRAKDELILTHARSRSLYGRRQVSRPSPFLTEIPEQYIRRTEVENRPVRPKQKQMKLF